MRRIGFRWALPVLFTLVHVALIWFSSESSLFSPSMVFHDSRFRTVAYQEGDEDVGVPAERPPLSAVQKIALILELPAMYLAMLIGTLFFPQSDAAWLYASIPFVPLLWYAVGRWLDGLVGYRTRWHLPTILRVLLAVPTLGVLGVSIVGFTPLYHHRNADAYWIFSGLVAWSLLCLTMLKSAASEPAIEYPGG